MYKKQLKKAKDAIALVVDVGPSMKKLSRDNETTVMELAKQCLSRIIEQKIFCNAKNEYVLVIMGSESHYEDHTRPGTVYEHITLVDDLQVANLKHLKAIKNLEPTTYKAKLSDALVVACNALVQGNAKYNNRKIGLVTNLDFTLNEGEASFLYNSYLKNHNIVLNLICDYNKDELETTPEICDCQNELINLLKMTHSANLVFNFQDAIENMAYLEPVQQDSAPASVKLEIGDELGISVIGYIKTTEHKRRYWSNAYINPDEPEPSTSTDIKKEPLEDQEIDDLDTPKEDMDDKDFGEMPSISKSITFLTSERARVVLEKDDTTKGYLFGKTIVPITAEDEQAMKYQSDRKGLQILFFTPADNIKLYFLAGKHSMIFTPDHRSKDLGVHTAFNSIVSSMMETKTVAVATYKRTIKANPQVGVLIPVYIGKSLVLVYNQLPYAEDIRYYKFPPLKDPKKRPQDIPSRKELDAIEDLINLMSLVAKTDDGETVEYLSCEEVHDPYDKNQFKAIVHRYLNPGQPLPEDLIKDESMTTPAHIMERCKPVLERINDLFRLQEASFTKRMLLESPHDPNKDVPSKKVKTENQEELETVVKSENNSNDNHTEGNNGNNMDSNGNTSGNGAVSDQAVQDFKNYELEILDLTKNLLGFNDNKMVKLLETYRTKAIETNASEQFNDFMVKLKEVIARRPAWKLIVKKGISLITKVENNTSKISADESEQFIKV